MQRNIEHVRRFFMATPRFFACLMAVLCLVAVLSPTVMATNVVTVTDTGSGEDVVVMTSSEAPHEILELAGIEALPVDEVLVKGAEEIESVTVRRNYPFEVCLRADGEEYTAEYIEGQAVVADLLAEFGIELSDEDYTSYALGSALEAGMQVEVSRVTYGTETLRAAVDERDVDTYIRTLPEDVAFKKSDKGEYDVTYRHRYDDGEITQSEILELLPVFGVRGEGTTDFLEGVAISRIEEFEGVTLGVDGLPTEYSYVMENAVATAYSSSRGTGASGLGLYYGTVAVDPAKIPYGTRLFITTADGSFVYGFAIATDTGTAMREGHVDIDLFFETNAECLRFGKRSLVVYVLD